MFKPKPTSIIDYYKTGHIRQTPKGLEAAYINITPRSDKYAPKVDGIDTRSVVFGVAGFVIEYLVEAWNEMFFLRPREEVVREYQRRCDNGLGKDTVDAEEFGKLHDLGYLPIRVKALPEGTRCPSKIPFMTIKSTHKDFAWLPGFMEDAWSIGIWKPATTASIGFYYRQVLDKYAHLTGSPLAFVPFQGHDFSLRGKGDYSDGARSGGGHLLSFVGTDTVCAIDYMEDYYGANSDTALVGCSVPASEHFVSSCNIIVLEAELRETGRAGKYAMWELLEVPELREDEGSYAYTDDDYKSAAETAFIIHYFTEIYPTGVASYVTDTYDYWRVLNVILRRKIVKDALLSRKPDANGNCKAVFRPDSGDPDLIINGDPNAAVGSPEFKGSLWILWDIFGGTRTSLNFKVLNSFVGLIYGDSITLQLSDKILDGMMVNGFASCNIVFGIGSYTYQMLSRDTYGFAVKATWCKVNGRAYEIYKDPKTDDGTKKSARGLIRVERVLGAHGSTLQMFDQQTEEEEEEGGELKVVFANGWAPPFDDHETIRARLWGGNFYGAYQAP